MLEELRIFGVGVIESAEVRPGSGLTVITGETGAGKSMLLGSLGLATGSPADPALVRRGQEQARVEAVFVLPPGQLGQSVAAAVEEAGGVLDDGALLVSRTQPVEGRSRCHLGGRSVPRASLTEVVSPLVAVHGQSEQMTLRRPARQRALLDSLGGRAQEGRLAAQAQAFEQWRQADAQLAEWRSGAAQREAEIVYLRTTLEQIEEVDPYAGEEDELRAEAERLTNVEDLRAIAGRALAYLSADPAEGAAGAASLLGEAMRAVNELDRFDPAPRPWASDLSSAQAVVADVAADLSSYLGALETDPARLEQVHQRRAAINTLLRGRAASTGELLEWAEQARHRLDLIDGPDDRAAALEEALAAASAKLAQTGAALTAARRELGAQLSVAVGQELEQLALKGARLSVEVAPAQVKAHGADEVTLWWQADPGLDPVPLGSGASGGELSRIMLALELVLAGAAQERRTLIFDEVDAGVGGRAATEIGLRLAVLARTQQVVVVTHLAQVAAFAGTHLVVEKHGDTTQVRELAAPERAAELARMLSGSEQAPTALRHGEELIAHARVRLSEA
ncbi:MAG: DNA repair protein RecN [Buchananella hordeovulneris]|nr:DNA repair protein RecN [Buchananella hordeovulneris]